MEGPSFLQIGALFKVLTVLGLGSIMYLMDLNEKRIIRGRRVKEVQQLDIASPGIRISQGIINRNFTKRIHLVISFPLYIQDGEENLSANKYIQAGNDLQLLNSRMKEYISCLKRNLNNPHVKRVHLLYDEDAMPDYIERQIGEREDLVLTQVKAPQITLTLHKYAFDNLQGELVMITQADVYLDKGFEYADRVLMGDNKLMYALSRHENGTENCPAPAQSNYCVHYIGSHEAYLFVPKEPLPDRAQKMLNHLTFSLGIDNMIVRVYRDVLGYRVLNPCLVLFVYHHHCSRLRATHTVRKRIKVVWDFWTPSSHDLV